jgi:hypothetical protein
METQPNKIDDFFREALHEHAVVPSEAAKAAFLKEAATLEGSRKFYTRWYFYLTAVVLLVSIGAGITLLGPQYPARNTGTSPSASLVSSTLPAKKENSSVTIPSSEHKLTPKEKTTSPVQTLTANVDHPQAKNSNITSSRILIPDNNRKANSLKTSSLFIKNANEQPYTSSTPVKKETSVTRNDHPLSSPVAPEPGPLTEAANLPLPETKQQNPTPETASTKVADTLKSADPRPVNSKRKSDPNQKRMHVALGVYYAPEWMFNTLEGDKYANNFGVEGTFHLGKYSIRTGAGLSITKGTHELSVNYNDYLGQYQKLDSIAFNWDQTHTKLLPTYYFSKESVWDSLMKTQNEKIIKRYTYLQVPLILGYDFWQNNHFSIGLRAGPILSVLLKTEQISDNYDPGKNRIVEINMITPDRIQTYWQFMLGFNASYNLSRRFGIELEPDVRYYFNSVYEKPVNNKKTWSAGIRIALLIKE